MIKFMVIIDYIDGLDGGTENQLLRLLKNIDRGKYEIHLVCLYDTRWLKEEFCIQQCTTKAFDYNVYNHDDIRNIYSLKAIIKYIRKIKPDIVITFFPTSNILGVLAARLAGVKNIVSTRRDFGLWLNKGTLPLLRFANKFVKTIVTNAEVIKRLVASKEGFSLEKIQVIYNGIDFKDIRQTFAPRDKIKEMLGIPIDNSVVGIVAGLRPMKRHEIFLKAATRILEQRKDVHFLLVGDGPMKARLEEQVKENGIARYIHFAGMQHDVRPFLMAFDIGVNCSEKEGLSNAIMEYMVYGIPCVVSNTGGNVELIFHDVNGYIFHVNDHDELAISILDLLSDKHKKHKFAEKAKSVIKNFSIETMVNSYETLFLNILSK